MATNRRAVVMGGGFAGTLVSAMLARHVDEVLVLDRDAYPPGPELRRGVPQARHCHILWSGGAHVMERFLPGTTDRLLAAGAHRIGIPDGLVSYTPAGWQHRFPATEFTLACSRALLDWTLHDQALRNPRITFRRRTEVLAPTGTARRVTGVRTRDLDTGEEHLVEADLVVDATGRGSVTKNRLAALGLGEPEQETVDTGIVYATRVFRAPHGAPAAFPLVSVLADPRLDGPGRNAVLMPIEDDRWIVTLSGTRGGEPPADEDGFLRYARESLRHPLIGELITGLEPLTGVQRSRSTVNRRLHYDRLPHWPEGLVVLGDAATAFNPVYGHGMSAAARSVAALDTELQQRRLAPGLARNAQRAVARAVDDAWMLATTKDIDYPGCLVDSDDERLIDNDRSGRRASDLMTHLATCNREVSRAAVSLMTLSATVADIQTPWLLAALRRGRETPALTEPPLHPAERAVLTTTYAHS